MTQFNKIITPLTIVILSFLLRLTLISKGPYHVDCLTLATQAEKTLQSGQLQHLFGFGYPLTVVLGSVFVYIGKMFFAADSVMSVNFMSVVFSSFSVAVLYFLAKELFGETTAVFSSIMFSVCPIFLGVSVYGKSTTLSIYFFLQGLYFLCVFLKMQNRKHLVLSGIFLGCMGAARIQDLILMTVPITALFFYPHQKLNDRPGFHLQDHIRTFIVFFLLVGCIAAAFHLPYFVQGKESHYFSQLSDFVNRGLITNFMGFLTPRLLLSSDYLVYTFTVGGLAISLVGLAIIFVRNIRIFLFLMLWILTPLAFYGNLHTNVTSRFLVIILPPLLMAQGYLFAELAKIGNKTKVAAYFAFLVILLVSFGRIYPLLKFRHLSAPLPEFAKWVTDVTEPNAHIIVGDEAPFYRYYGNRSLITRPESMNILDKNVLLEFQQEVDNVIQKGDPVYITSIGLYAYDSEQHFSGFVKSLYEGIWIGDHYYEDWHRGAIVRQVFPVGLYKIEGKKTPRE